MTDENPNDPYNVTEPPNAPEENVPEAQAEEVIQDAIAASNETELTEPTPDPLAEAATEVIGTDPAIAEAAAAAPEQSVARRGKGDLEVAIFDVTNDYADGQLQLDEGKRLTPHLIGKLIQERQGLDKAPSTGAITACLHRWYDYGFAVVTEDKPFAFVDYTQAAVTDGLAELKASHRQAKKDAKDGASAPADAAPEPEVADPQADFEEAAPVEAELSDLVNLEGGPEEAQAVFENPSVDPGF